MDHDANPDPLEHRLRALGDQPVDARTAAHHRARIDGALAVSSEVGRRRRFGPVAVAAAGVIGFLAGSTSLAMAGALPDPAQDVAHDVLGVVQVDVPKGKEGKRGPCVSEAAKLADKEAKQAAKDACPKGGQGVSGDEGDAPGRSGDAPGRSGDAPGHSGDAPGRSGDAPGQVKHADDPCRGRPEWAGPMSKEERERAKAEHSRDACLDDDDASDESTSDDDATSDG